jgi:hypothetical protein
MKSIDLSIELVNAVLQYMASRPYNEVFQLIAAIQEQATKQASPEPDKPAES